MPKKPYINNKDSKTCPDCQKEKSLSDFFQSPRPKGKKWVSRRCKPCHNKYCAGYRRTLEYKETHDKWKNSERGKKVIKNRMANWRKNNKDKRIAQSAISNAIRDGRLKRQPCIICSLPDAEAHHPNYRKPLQVVWLCKKHHSQIHFSYKINL